VIAADAGAELREFAERIKAPTALTLMALGALDCGHPLYTGMVGMHGTAASNRAVQSCDLLIALGARFSDRVTGTGSAAAFAPNARVLQFDVDAAEINKNVRSDFEVRGNLREILRQTLDALPAAGLDNEWRGETDGWKALVPPSYSNLRRKAALHPRFVVEETAARLGDAAIAVTDVGQHQMWAAQFYPHRRPRAFLSSGGFGTMGFGLGAALGAKTANPARPVVLFTGDGSFRMNCAELGTLAAYGVPVLIVIFNNGTLGMVRQWQRLFHGGRYSESTLDRPPDFVRLAAAYGLPAYRSSTSRAFTAALDKALADNAAGKTAVIDALIEIDEAVLPMVPGGKPIDQQIL
jgi:acetolactate synthase-1/2/3 large subunit